MSEDRKSDEEYRTELLQLLAENDQSVARAHDLLKLATTPEQRELIIGQIEIFKAHHLWAKRLLRRLDGEDV